jgi:hypothetical protein
VVLVALAAAVVVAVANALVVTASNSNQPRSLGFRLIDIEKRRANLLGVFYW